VVRSDVEGEGLIATLIELGPSLGGKAVLFPCGDPQVLEVSEHRSELARYYLLNLPDPQVVRTLMFKDSFATYAAQHGYPIPHTFVVNDEPSLERAALAVRYPCILKPTVRSARWEAERLPKNYLVDSAEALRAAYRQFQPLTPRATVQEWIPGSDEDVYFCLIYFDCKGRPASSFTGRKLRQWPPQRGCTAIATGHTSGELEELTLRFFAEVDFRGLGSMEYRLDPREGRWLMIEPTVGRIDLQSGVSELYGLSLPWVAYADLAGAKLGPHKLHQANGRARWIHEEGVVRLWARGLIRRSMRLKEWRSLVQGRRRYAVFARDDPGPALALLCDGARRAWFGMRRRLLGLVKE